MANFINRLMFKLYTFKENVPWKERVKSYKSSSNWALGLKAIYWEDKHTFLNKIRQYQKMNNFNICAFSQEIPYQLWYNDMADDGDGIISTRKYYDGIMPDDKFEFLTKHIDNKWMISHSTKYDAKTDYITCMTFVCFLKKEDLFDFTVQFMDDITVIPNLTAFRAKLIALQNGFK